MISNFEGAGKRLMLVRGLRVGLVGLLCGLVGVVAFSGAVALGAGDANEASCANEGMPGFRSYMADCRAYELVSPSLLGGQPVGKTGTLVVSAMGRVMLQSQGGAAGTGNSAGFGAIYVSARGASSWLTSPLEPPASLLGVGDIFIIAKPVAASSDFGKALFGMHTVAEPADADNLYVSEPGGGFVEVGPMVPASALVAAPGPDAFGSPIVLYTPFGYEGGASSDLSHVVFTLLGPASEGGHKTHRYLWPGDSTMQGPEEEQLPSLYEYVGTGNTEPKLVGVSDQHALASNAEAHLISQCGTEAGSGLYGGEKYNDVSADGSVVFFTALHNGECSGEQPPVNELDARIDGEKTVAVAEPSLSYCAGSPSPPCGSVQFAGASEDGSRVFFTTRQSLLGEDEGGAGTGTDLYEAEINDGVRTGLVQVSHDPEGPLAAAEVRGVVRVSEDGSHVYFVAKGVLTSTPNTSLAVGQQVAVAGQDNLYVYERDSAFPGGHVEFVGTLTNSDSRVWSSFDLRPVDVTPDGRFLLFASSADLTPGDTSTVAQVFRYDAVTGTLVRVSVGQEGFNENGNTNTFAASLTRAPSTYFAFSSPSSLTRTMSDDGEYVFFQSADALTPSASNGANNVYEYHNGEVSLVSDGQDRAHVDGEEAPAAQLYGTDASGQDVFFGSADELTAEDGSDQQVLWDARVGGGFAPPSPVECSGDGCQGALGGTPGSPAVGSAGVSAEGPLAPPPAVAGRAKPKPVSSRSSRLARALRACARQHGKHRQTCQAHARARYGARSKTSKNRGRGR